MVRVINVLTEALRTQGSGEANAPLNSACAAGGASGSSDVKVFLFGPRKDSSLALIPLLVNNRFLSALISVSTVANCPPHIRTHASHLPPATRMRSTASCRDNICIYIPPTLNPVNVAIMVAAAGRLFGFLSYTAR